MSVKNIPNSNNKLTGFLRHVKQLALLLAMVSMSGTVFAASWDSGVEALRENRLQEALSLLQEVRSAGDESQELFYYLGMTYELLGRSREAYESLNRGMNLPGTRTALMAFNAGNNAYKAQLFDQAEGAFSRCLIEDSSRSVAYLNRGNTRVRLGLYDLAIADYRTYLDRNPGDSQKSSIEAMISRLKNQILEAERIKAEQERLRREEEERQKRLLEEVLSSLETASEDTTNLTSDPDELDEYEEDWDLAE